MTVIRRLDAVLEDTKEDVLRMKETLDKAGILNQTDALCNASGQPFFNSSPFTLKDLKARAKNQQLKADFIAYLDGFSPNVQEILEKFKFRYQIDTMVEADILGAVIEKFVSPVINLSPNPVLDDRGEVKLPGLDNHAMGVIFEELIRKFNEENNEEAGEHFTPRDVIYLMADVIFLPIKEKIKDGTYLCYDGACGTGGMLTIAEERLSQLAKENNKEVSIHLYGQESQPETYAVIFQIKPSFQFQIIRNRFSGFYGTFCTLFKEKITDFAHNHFISDFLICLLQGFKNNVDMTQLWILMDNSSSYPQTPQLLGQHCALPTYPQQLPLPQLFF